MPCPPILNLTELRCGNCSSASELAPPAVVANGADGSPLEAPQEDEAGAVTAPKRAERKGVKLQMLVQLRVQGRVRTSPCSTLKE